MRRALLVIGWLVVAACGRSPALDKRAGRTIRPANHARSVAARMAALQMDHATARDLLGAHRFRASHKVRVTLDAPSKT